MLTSHTARPHIAAEETTRGERGYSTLFFYPSGAWVLGLITTLVIIGISAALYMWFDRPGYNRTPAGPAGLAFAFAGTAFFLLALVGYAVQRHSRKRMMGKLNAALSWHVFLAIIALALLTFHAFGHFAAISGTYALIGLIVLSLSGVVGRLLDRILPRKIAALVDKALTAQGDDRGETISQEIRAIVSNGNFSARQPAALPPGLATSAAPVQDALSVPWDLAYISLEPTQQELDRDAPHYRFIPDKKSALSRVDVFMPPAERPMAEWRQIQRAMRREQVYRSLLRLWRILHIALAVIAVGLIIWHIIFATTMLATGQIH